MKMQTQAQTHITNTRGSDNLISAVVLTSNKCHSVAQTGKEDAEDTLLRTPGNHNLVIARIKPI